MDSIRARHILVESEDEAKKVLTNINDGKSFEEMAANHSKCPSGQKGGDLGTFKKGQMVKEFEAAAFALDVGQISTPIKTQFGYHLIQRIEE